VERITLLAEEGWRDGLIEAGAPGAKREPARSASAIARSLKRRAKPQQRPSPVGGGPGVPPPGFWEVRPASKGRP